MFKIFFSREHIFRQILGVSSLQNFELNKQEVILNF